MYFDGREYPRMISDGWGKKAFCEFVDNLNCFS